jgi:hypothetical protein
MTKKVKKPQFSVAMSKDTGCVVMVRTNGTKATVIGALTREDSLKFADGLLDWVPEAALAETAPRPAYPH